MTKRRKLVYKNRRKRKLYFSVLLVCLFMIGLGYANLVSNLNIGGTLRIDRYDHTLYGVLEKAAKKGVYATTYTGEHQDSFTNTSTKNIYHWYATTDAVGTEILDKNNVIFAGQCWQMIRTTDTGGVKLIYNGEAENDQCLNTRDTHIGYGDRTSQTLNSSYYYGTDYTYDATNNVFTLAGSLEQKKWDATTGPTLIGKYTCKSASETGTCATIYLIESYNTATSAYAFPISKNSHYSQFGTLAYNNNFDSPAYVGYMYNDVYPVTSKSNSFAVTSSSAWTVNTNYYYSDTIDWNTTTANSYTLLHPQQLLTLSGDYSSLVGKYVIRNTNATNYTTVSYIIAVDSNKLYYKDLTNGDLNTTLTIGDSYTESGGVYTLSGNVTNVPYQTWYNSSSLGDYKGKYVCDGNNTSCTNLKHIYPSGNPSKNYYYYFDPTTTWSFAESVSYNGSSYTLTGDIKTFWDFYDTTNQTTITTHHYTCLGNGTSCTTVGYVNYIASSIYYAQLNGVEDIETAINNMLYKADVNTKNSPIKSAVDAWFVKYLSGYDAYLEDTIFCNDRTIKSLGGWNPDGGGITSSSNYLQFQEYSSSKDLSCDRATDQFSILNNSAKLTYKVGLMSSPEMNLLNNSKIRATGSLFWLASPNFFSYGYASVRIVGAIGGLGVNNSYLANGLRPAVSILPGTVYTSGDGSMASPYIVDAPPVEPQDFATDSWETIVMAAKTGNTSAYQVGDTKEVDMGELGTHTLRIANKSTPSECSTTGFSQTACGFVLEFADIITTHRMNLYTSGDSNLDGSTVNGTGNKGGWEYSDMRAYLNSTTYANENIDYSTTGIYSSLPEVLRNAVIDTTVVSGHGSTSGEANFTSTDKLYLLSTHEVWEDVDGNTSSGIDRYDTAYNNTRQLDYYANIGVTTSNNAGAMKQLNGSNYFWWLRSARSNFNNHFFRVYDDGHWGNLNANNTFGVSPAFRIG